MSYIKAAFYFDNIFLNWKYKLNRTFSGIFNGRTAAQARSIGTARPIEVAGPASVEPNLISRGGSGGLVGVKLPPVNQPLNVVVDV